MHRLAGRRLNQAFAWTRAAGIQSSRSKVYLPDAPDGWEATWFARGTLDPAPLTCNGVQVGFQLCTEMFFTDLEHRPGRRADHSSPTSHRRASSLAAADKPIATVIIDLQDATSAKQSNPRNLPQG